jgi:uncharacterized protein (DUF58 family)
MTLDDLSEGTRRDRVRMTSAGRGLLLGGLVAGVLAQLAGSRWLQLAGVAMLALLVTGFVLVPRGRRLPQVVVDTDRRAVVGEPVELRVTLTGARRNGAAAAIVAIRAFITDDAMVASASLRPAESTSVVVPVTALRRGRLRAFDVELVVSDPFGLFTREHRSEIGADLVVHPPALRVQCPPPSPRRADGDDVSTSGSGGDPFALRDWFAGDAVHDVNWRASARRGQLVVTERSRPGRRAVVVTVSAIDEHELEHAVAVAASAAAAALRAGDAVAVATAGSDVVIPVDRVVDALDHLAAVDADGIGARAEPRWLQRLPTGVEVWIAGGAPLAGTERHVVSTVVAAAPDSAAVPAVAR